MSFAMAAFGLITSLYMYKETRSIRLSGGMFFFFTMEFLQGFQYIWIDDCSNPINKVLTMLGFIHIVCQPFFCHFLCSALAVSQVEKAKYNTILGLCALGGIWLLGRVAMHPWAQYHPSDACPSTEWLRGTEVCTFSGQYHLSWSVPMYDQTYFSPGASVHFFLMFAPFLVMGPKMIVLGLFLLLTGPVLASYITPSLFEQASIWCFYSCVQTAIMIFLWWLQNGCITPPHLDYRPPSKTTVKKTK
jgi:hypothetical protein